MRCFDSREKATSVGSWAPHLLIFIPITSDIATCMYSLLFDSGAGGKLARQSAGESATVGGHLSV
jgi:hypothetical protein